MKRFMDRRDVLMAGTGVFAADLLSRQSASAPAARPVARPVKIRDVVIGEGRVKAIVPITGATADEAIAQASRLAVITAPEKRPPATVARLKGIIEGV